MKVYTKTGDKGQTSLFNGSRVPKNHALVDAYGTVDECNATIGMAVSHMETNDCSHDEDKIEHRDTLVSNLKCIQNQLFDLGAHLATPRSTSSMNKIIKTSFPETAATQLEVWIDTMDKELPPLTTFILPGGHPAAATLHLARTVMRRAERAVTPLFTDEENGIDPNAYAFMNRLSDYLFVAARYANMILGNNDVLWTKATESKEP